MDVYKQKVAPFEGVSFYENENGYIAWRRGTGDNVELLHIRVYVTQKGHATKLLKEMVKQLSHHPPYHSVYVFVLANNHPALCAYDSWGFKLTRIEGLYKKGGTVIGTIPYTTLRDNLGV